MNTIISKLQNLPKFQEYISKIEEKNSQIAISGLSDVGKIQYIYATKESTNRPICIVTYNEIQAKKIVEEFVSRAKAGFLGMSSEAQPL